MQLSGILPVNKPVGLRSTQCVQEIRRILGKGVKTGHGGTLDSTASGLLLILIGSATRLSNFIMEMPKSYEAEISFGMQTSTDDASGDVIYSAPFGHITDAAIDSALCGFMGWTMQAPPAVSAVHIGGERAHSLARGGRAVTPEAKPVYISSVVRISSVDDNGKVRIRVNCRKGTYIRSFARDLGRTLGSAAHVSALERLSSGPFSSSSAKDARDLFGLGAAEIVSLIKPFSTLYGLIPTYEAGAAAYEALRNGRGVRLSELRRLSIGAASSGIAKFVVASEKIFSICTAAANGGSLGLSPEVNIMIQGGETL